MDNRQEIDELKAQSRWSGKRVVLLYWMAIMFLGTGFAIGLGKTVLDPQYMAGEAGTTFDHSSQTCETLYCHSDVVAEWGATEHNTTYMYNSSHVAVGGSAFVLRPLDEFNLTCAHCMSTRWVNGSTAAEVEYVNLGVACLSCHEPGVANHSSSNCGQCHTDPEGGTHAAYEDWQKSGHSDTLSNFASRSNPSSCLKCLVGQASWQVNFNTTGWNASDPTETATWVDISCSTCHDPHDETYNHQLRVNGSTTLCGTCHGTTYSTHHQSNATFFGGRQPHEEVGCTDCHGYSLVFDHGDWQEYVNHTWVIDDRGVACNVSGCHNVTDGAIQMASIEVIQGHTEEMYDEWNTTWYAATAVYETALGTADVDTHVVDFVLEMLDESEHLAHLVDYDHSLGFHNPSLTEGRLTAAIELAHMAEALAQEAIDNAATPATEYVTVSTTVYETTTVTVSPGFLLLPALAFLGLAALIIRKKRR
ncbi:MAG: multiheme c-type cytochrome [Candidatus Hodarchaeales archaeon]|jgi:predicted CXXCH cytochrome family protein